MWGFVMEKKLKFDYLKPYIDEAFDKDERFIFKPNGVSMQPFIKGGCDAVEIEKYTGGAEKHDIVFYRRPDGKYVLHRIVKICNDCYGVCGDNQWWVEKIVDEQIFARVTSVDGKKKTGGFVYLHTLPLRRFIIHVKAYIKRRLGGDGK